jgi:hypothetical protein
MHHRSGRETPERRRPPHLAALVGALALTLAVAACGGGAKAGGVASLNGSRNPTTTTTTTNDRQDPRQAALDFAKCMREHGINVPDPEITGSNGNLTVKNKLPVGVNRKDPRLKAAQEACKKYMPNGGQPPKPNPQQHQQALQFAKCMREHGISGFPDPSPDGSFVSQGDLKEDSPQFKAAQQACQKYLDGPGKGSGR